MATPLMMGNDLSSLGQNILQAFATESQARARQNDAQNQLLAQIANSRLGQQQIAQRSQSDTFHAALQVAALRDAQDQRRQDFQNVMAQEASRNAARMAELDRSIVGNKDIARIQNERYGGDRLAIEEARNNADIEARNQMAKAAAAAANQKLAVIKATRESKRGKQNFWLQSGRDEYEAGLDLEESKAIADILDDFGEERNMVRYDSARKEFIPVEITPRPIPGVPDRSALPIPPRPQPQSAAALPPEIQAALMAVAGAGPAMAAPGGTPAPTPEPIPAQTPVPPPNNQMFGLLRPSITSNPMSGLFRPSPAGSGTPPGPIVVQNGVRFQLGPNGWVPIQ